MNISLYNNYKPDFTLVPNAFIDTCMTSANGEFVKVYLYILRCSSVSENFSVSTAADLLNQTEADIMRALRFWDKANVLSLSYDAAGQAITGVSFLPLAATDTPNVSAHGTTVAGNVTYASALQTAAPKDHTPKKEEYTPKRIAEFSDKDDFSMLLFALGSYLGGTLSASNIQTIAYIYDALHFSCDLIEYLVEYCATNGHKSMRYIEKTALNWAEAGITNVEEAKAETTNHNSITYAILNAFGISGRNPGKREKDYISKWTTIYSFDDTIILEACDRTLRATHQPSFEYADSILTKWKNANVKTPADIKKADAEYELLRAKKNTKSSTKAAAAPASNRFNHFSQRDTNIDDLENALLDNFRE